MSFTCPQCGLPLYDEDAFCGNCGRPAGTQARDGSGGPAGEQTAPPSWSTQRSDLPVGRPPGGPPRFTGSFPRERDEQAYEPEPDPHSHWGRGRPDADGEARIRSGTRAAPARSAGAAAQVPVREITRIDANADQRLSYAETSSEPTFDPLRNSRFGWQLAAADYARRTASPPEFLEHMVSAMSRADWRTLTPRLRPTARRLIDPDAWRAGSRTGVFTDLVLRTGRDLYAMTCYQTLRYDSTRATVAAMHACTLEGLDAAIRTIDPEGGLLGSAAPVPAS